MEMKKINKDICLRIGYNIWNYAITPDKFTLYVPWLEKIGLKPWSEYSIFQNYEECAKSYISLMIYTECDVDKINNFIDMDLEISAGSEDGPATQYECVLTYEDFEEVYNKLITLESLLFGGDTVIVDTN